jgi:hypothetical protein
MRVNANQECYNPFRKCPFASTQLLFLPMCFMENRYPEIFI